MSDERGARLGGWTLFCKLVDNFGDIGVCWRLAKCLALHNGISVTLVVDDIDTLRILCPELPYDEDEIFLDGVTVIPWIEASDALEPDDVVIEAFACELPEAFLERMCRRKHTPLWINLEYLSAESWVEDCHLMRSPHPRLPLVKHFFFPGFTGRTGGLLRETGLFERRDDFQRDDGASTRFLAENGCPEPVPGSLLVSLFCYEQPALAGLFGAWSGSARPVTVFVPVGRVLDDVAAFFGKVPEVGARLKAGALTVAVLPFLSQDDYDRLLWSCDLNFVRGEDSFVRAQWAARPFVWQAYRQDDAAHMLKLEAFLSRFADGLDPDSRRATEAFWQAWNEGTMQPGVWNDFYEHFGAYQSYCARWANQLAEYDDLTTSLLEFSKKSV